MDKLKRVLATIDYDLWMKVQVSNNHTSCRKYLETGVNCLLPEQDEEEQQYGKEFLEEINLIETDKQQVLEEISFKRNELIILQEKLHYFENEVLRRKGENEIRKNEKLRKKLENGIREENDIIAVMKGLKANNPLRQT